LAPRTNYGFQLVYYNSSEKKRVDAREGRAMNNPRKGNVSVVEEKFTDDETCDLKVTQENFESIVRQLQEERRLNRQAERLAGLGFWEGVF
jgi:hypothetical protein